MTASRVKLGCPYPLTKLRRTWCKNCFKDNKCHQLELSEPAEIRWIDVPLYIEDFEGGIYEYGHLGL